MTRSRYVVGMAWVEPAPIEELMIGQRGKAPSQRQLRVGEVMRHALAHLLERGVLRDPDLRGLSITVTEVSMSPDLKAARAYVVPLGGGEIDVMLEALNRAAPFLRGQLAREVRLRGMPRLVFAADESFDYAARIGALLERPAVAKDLERGELGDNLAPGDGDGA
jgi:ribosome-binding factor A